MPRTRWRVCGNVHTIRAPLRPGRPESPLKGSSADRDGSTPTDLGSTTKSSVRSGVSSRREQPPLPVLAGFEFIAKDVPSDDGSLSTLR